MEKEWARYSFNNPLELLVLKYLPYLSPYFPVKEDYQASRAILSRTKTQTTAVFFWIHDE